MAWILLAFAIVALVVIYLGRNADAKKAAKAAEEAKRAASESERRFQQQIDELTREVTSLRPFQNVRDAMAATAVLRAEGRQILDNAQRQAEALRSAVEIEISRVRSEAAAEANRVRSEAAEEENRLKLDARASYAHAQAKIVELTDIASKRAETLIADAELRAAEVMGGAYRALHDAQRDSEALRRSVEIETSRFRSEAAAEANRTRSEAAAEASRVRSEAAVEANRLKLDARTSHADAQAKIAALTENANRRAETIIADAELRAAEVVGDAYRALKEADQLKRVTVAMENVIEGYGDRYLVPTYSLLDELGEAYGFDQAGRELTAAREISRNLVTSGRAAECDYVEANRRETALRFVLDAFNGKVDTILARAKSDNVGTLEQQVKDAFSLVNHNGAAFRNARITPDYLSSRLKELKWVVSVQALKEREKEEQRRIREQIREEEKAQREIERALKESAKEEDFLQKALQKVQAQVAKANEEQRAGFEAKLLELRSKLADAEAKNQRALSMAQQTKAGHVYVISNVGSFGEEVLKVGMTRRLEPVDRIRELGDASVPFGFDIHAMIWTDDAPALERELHRRFVRNQINKVNPRKEFFRIPLSAVRDCVDAMGLEAAWTISAEAMQYRETLAIEKSLLANTSVAQDWLRTQLQFSPEVVSDVAESEPGGEETTSRSVVVAA